MNTAPETQTALEAPQIALKKPRHGSIQNPDFSRFALRCEQMRSACGWSQTDVATRAGVSRSAVAQVESGKRGGTLETAARIAKVLGINITATLWDTTPITFSTALQVKDDENEI